MEAVRDTIRENTKGLARVDSALQSAKSGEKASPHLELGRTLARNPAVSRCEACGPHHPTIW